MDKRLIARVRRREEDFDRVRLACQDLEAALDTYEAMQKRVARLRAYTESGQWLQDFEADERGEIPADVKRGVLSEDGLDDLFTGLEQLHERMRLLSKEKGRSR